MSLRPLDHVENELTLCKWTRVCLFVETTLGVEEALQLNDSLIDVHFLRDEGVGTVVSNYPSNLP